MASYRVTINNKVYELPPCTLSIEERIEEMSRIDKRYNAGEITVRDVRQMQFDFLSTCVPGAFEDIETADMNDLLAATLSVISVYTAPAIKAKNEAMLSQIKPVMNSPEMKTAAAIIKAAK